MQHDNNKHRCYWLNPNLSTQFLKLANFTHVFSFSYDHTGLNSSWISSSDMVNLEPHTSHACMAAKAKAGGLLFLGWLPVRRPRVCPILVDTIPQEHLDTLSSLAQRTWGWIDSILIIRGQSLGAWQPHKILFWLVNAISLQHRETFFLHNLHKCLNRLQDKLIRFLWSKVKDQGQSDLR